MQTTLLPCVGMPLETLLINGPLESGKSTVARLIADQVLNGPAHLLRLQRAPDAHTNAVIPLRAIAGNALHDGWASMHRVTYTVDRVFETIPDGLRAVRRLERGGFTIIEADDDPSIRHAYPYDYRIFVMSPPASVHQVFREPEAAALALHQVMQDTAAFASEIFGLFDGDELDDSVGVRHHKADMVDQREGPLTSLESLEISEAQIRQFLNSPIGAEIASRIQLQPEFHALVEADVALINTGIGPHGQPLDECIRRIQKLLSRLRHDARRHSVLYWGDVTDHHDPAHQKLIRRLKTLITN